MKIIFFVFTLFFLAAIRGPAFSANPKETAPSGVVKSHYRNGSLKLETFYDKGVLVMTRSYYKNGRVEQETPYKEKKREGISQKFYENGRLKEEVYWMEGKKHGPAKKYDQNSRLKAIFHYRNNVLIKKEKF